MRQVIRKVFWAWEFDKEEQWLNDMAAQGKALVSTRYFTYEFEDSRPGEYAVRLEMLENHPDSSEGRQYIAFVEETGAEYVGKVMKWVYFRKKTADGPFELHGDNATRIRHLAGIIRLLLPLTAPKCSPSIRPKSTRKCAVPSVRCVLTAFCTTRATCGTSTATRSSPPTMC